MGFREISNRAAWEAHQTARDGNWFKKICLPACDLHRNTEARPPARQNVGDVSAEPTSAPAHIDSRKNHNTRALNVALQENALGQLERLLQNEFVFNIKKRTSPFAAALPTERTLNARILESRSFETRSDTLHQFEILTHDTAPKPSASGDATTSSTTDKFGFT
jgi:hypothetical protein